MCILVIAQERKMTEEEFRNCFASNKDGAGFAWRHKGKNVYAKGFMSEDEAWKFYCKKVKGLPHIAHFRHSTSGGVSPEMTHPMIVDEASTISLQGKTDKKLVFHNGVWSKWDDFLVDLCLKKGIMIPDGSWNDTRVMAMAVNYLGVNAIKFLDDRSKYAVMMEDGSIFLTNRRQFQKEKGILFSNQDYKGKPVSWYGGAWGKNKSNYGNTNYTTVKDNKNQVKKNKGSKSNRNNKESTKITPQVNSNLTEGDLGDGFPRVDDLQHITYPGHIRGCPCISCKGERMAALQEISGGFGGEVVYGDWGEKFMYDGVKKEWVELYY